MMAFNFEGKIQKYASPEEIIEEFYPQRLAYYQKRKEYLANELQIQFERLSNQARFVKMIVDKELVVSNRKKNDLMAELRRLKFRPFPKVTKAKAAGETEDVIQHEDEEDEAEESIKDAGTTDYDYLLGMAIWSLTKEKIEKLMQQAADKDAELLALLERSPNDLWNEDLDIFMKEWEKSCQEFDNKSLLDANGKKIKKKQATLEHRKSLPGRKKVKADSDSEFEMAPATQAKGKGKAKAKEEPVKRKSAKVEEDSDEDYIKPAAKKMKTSQAPMTDFFDKKPPGPSEPKKPVARKPSSSKPAPVKKAIAKKESDDDIIIASDSDAPLAPPKRPARAKTKKYIEIESDSVSETEDVSMFEED
jgi:DNA topoisomerase-2